MAVGSRRQPRKSCEIVARQPRLACVTDSAQATATTPAQILKVTPAPDDAGAEAMDRFDWQCAMATADLLAVYNDLLTAGETTNGVVIELICEHHEDWALLIGDDADIVSAKHLEREFGTYSTLKQVLDDGGVLHLFDRWVALKQLPRCRVMTTPSLSGDARQLEKACEHFAGQEGEVEVGEFEELLTKLAAEIVRRRTVKARSADPKSEVVFAPESAETLAAFLRVLRFTHSRPFRDDLAYSAGDRYAMPVAVALGHPEAADAIWEALMNVVRERMRAAVPSLGRRCRWCWVPGMRSGSRGGCWPWRMWKPLSVWQLRTRLGIGACRRRS